MLHWQKQSVSEECYLELGLKIMSCEIWLKEVGMFYLRGGKTIRGLASDLQVSEGFCHIKEIIIIDSTDYLISSRYLTHLIILTPLLRISIIIPVLQMRKLRLDRSRNHHLA